nr:MAG TPA: hypothetical protein [Caudoviricetes sp.]
MSAVNTAGILATTGLGVFELGFRRANTFRQNSTHQTLKGVHNEIS